MEMRFCACNKRSLYKATSLTVTRERAKYELDLIVVQELRRGRSGTEPVGQFLCRNGQENYESGTEFFVYKRNIPSVKRILFVSDRMPADVM
jgi:hypothetical protein